MKRSAAFLIAGISFLVLGKLHPTMATVSTKINATAQGGNSSVTVNSNVNSNSYNSTTTNQSETHVVIESNGERKEYHSNDGGSVHLESSDGKSQVNINNNGAKSSPTSKSTVNNSINIHTNTGNHSATPSASLNPTATPSATTTIKSNFDVFEFIRQLFKSIFG